MLFTIMQLRSNSNRTNLHLFFEWIRETILSSFVRFPEAIQRTHSNKVLLRYAV